MKLILILTMFCLLTVGLGCGDNSKTTPTGSSVPLVPKLEISQSEFDFGFAPQNATIAHTFWLHSTGTAPVEIIKIVPG